MKDEGLYLVIEYKNEEPVGYMYVGQPKKVAAYESLDSARRAAIQKRASYKRQGITTKIVKVQTMEVVE